MPAPRRPARMTRFLENERLLARSCCSPRRSSCSGVFIAYPFVMGVWLSLIKRQRGQSGRVRRAPELRQGVERLDLPDRVLQHVLLHVLGDHLQAGARACGWRSCSTGTSAASASCGPPCSCRSSCRPCSRTFAWRWMFDPTFSVLNWLLYQGGFITTKLPVPLRRHLRHVVRDRGQHVARHAVLRHHAPGRAADHQPRSPGGGLARRRQRLAALLARDLAAPQAGDRWWSWCSRSSRPSPTSS